jgi:hypothetical protein
MAPMQRSNMFFIMMFAELFGCWYADLANLQADSKESKQRSSVILSKFE